MAVLFVPSSMSLAAVPENQHVGRQKQAQLPEVFRASATKDLDRLFHFERVSNVGA